MLTTNEEDYYEAKIDGDGYSNSYQRVTAIEVMETRFSKVKKQELIDLSSRGFWVLVSGHNVFSHITDALIGYSESMSIITTNKELIDDFLSDFEEDGDLGFRIIAPERI